MKRNLLILLLASSFAVHAQEAPDYAPGNPYYGPFDEMHAYEKHREQIAIGLRVQQILKVASDRNEARYADNRRRCQAALKVAELCGTFAGTCAPSCRSPIAVKAAPILWFIENRASCAPLDFIVQPCAVPGGRLAKSPRIIVQRSPPTSSSISPRITSTAAWLLRYACRGIAAPVFPVNVASS